MSFFNSFELPLTTVRPFNTYGPRQSSRAVIPSIISQIASGKEQIFLGDLNPTRDFNYVNDTCRAFVELALCEDAVGEVVNVGSNFEISIKETFEMIAEIMKKDVEFIQEKERMRPKKSEVYRLWCDNTKIKKLTGFEPEYSIRSGLEKTIDWFTNDDNLKKYKSDIYNV